MTQGVFVHGWLIFPSSIGGERTSGTSPTIAVSVSVMICGKVYQRFPLLVVGEVPPFRADALHFTGDRGVTNSGIPVVKQPVSGHVRIRHFTIAGGMVEFGNALGDGSSVGVMGGAEVGFHPHLLADFHRIVTVAVIVLHRVVNHLRFELLVAGEGQDC